MRGGGCARLHRPQQQQQGRPEAPAEEERQVQGRDLRRFEEGIRQQVWHVRVERVKFAVLCVVLGVCALYAVWWRLQQCATPTTGTGTTGTAVAAGDSKSGRKGGGVGGEGEGEGEGDSVDEVCGWEQWWTWAGLWWWMPVYALWGGWLLLVVSHTRDAALISPQQVGGCLWYSGGVWLSLSLSLSVDLEGAGEDGEKKMKCCCRCLWLWLWCMLLSLILLGVVVFVDDEEHGHGDVGVGVGIAGASNFFFLFWLPCSLSSSSTCSVLAMMMDDMDLPSVLSVLLPGLALVATLVVALCSPLFFLSSTAVMRWMLVMMKKPEDDNDDSRG